MPEKFGEKKLADILPARMDIQKIRESLEGIFGNTPVHVIDAGIGTDDQFLPESNMAILESTALQLEDFTALDFRPFTLTGDMRAQLNEVGVDAAHTILKSGIDLRQPLPPDIIPTGARLIYLQGVVGDHARREVDEKILQNIDAAIPADGQPTALLVTSYDHELLDESGVEFHVLRQLLSLDFDIVLYAFTEAIAVKTKKAAHAPPSNG